MNTSDSDDPPDFDNLDVAVAHWHVNAWGGAEYLVTKLAEALDCQTVYTVGTPDPDDPNPYGEVQFIDVIDSLSPRPLRKIQGRVGRIFEYGLWEDVDWREYGHPDVLITSGATTRAVITPDNTLHVNYCHSPPRWFYDLYHDRKDSLAGVLARPLLRYLRVRDAALDPRVDHYFANSPIIARRLQKYYNRESETLYPPLDLDEYHSGGDAGYYLHLGRLDTEKGVPAVVEAFEEQNDQLVMAGGEGDVNDGVRNRIEAAENIDYRGFVSNKEKLSLLSECTAVVFNGSNEDFGIVPVEALASGKPVLARDEGFPSLLLTPGEDGYLHDGTASGIREAIAENHKENAGSSSIVDRFSFEHFSDQLSKSITEQYECQIKINAH